MKKCAILYTIILLLTISQTANAWHAWGKVHCDTNDDCHFNTFDPCIPGVRFTAEQVNDQGVLLGFSAEGTTVCPGYFSIALLDEPAMYKITLDRSTLPSGAVICNTTGNTNVRFIDLTDDIRNDMSKWLIQNVCQTGEIGDTVFCDLNDNGVQDAGELGIAGARVSLTCNMSLVEEQFTDGEGKYLFTNLPPCDYEVKVVPPITSDPCTEVGKCPTTVPVDLAQGESFLDADFCFTIPCSDCDGKVTELTLQYNGPGADIVVTQKGGKKQPDIEVFADFVAALGQFTFYGDDKNDTFGKEIKIFVGSTETKIHTSCSRPIGPGSVFGDFLVIEAFSRHGGRICPDGDGDGEFNCKDAKPITSLFLRWEGTGVVNIMSEGGQEINGIIPGPGGVITLNTAGLGNDVDVDIFDAVSGDVVGSSRFHVSCSDQDMNGPEDCGKNQGNGKDNNSGRINDWIFEGMAGDLTFDCAP